MQIAIVKTLHSEWHIIRVIHGLWRVLNGIYFFFFAMSYKQFTK